MNKQYRAHPARSIGDLIEEVNKDFAPSGWRLLQVIEGQGARSGVETYVGILERDV